MKKLMLLVSVIISAMVFGQDSKRDSLLRAVDDNIKNVFAAAEQFLNTNASPAERIKAIEPYTMLYDEKQKERFKGVVLNKEETSEVRAMALNKIHDKVHGDEALTNQAIEWLGNFKAPAVVRLESLGLARELSFSSMGVMTVYQKLLEDPDPEFRILGFTQLVYHGDARAQQLLIKGLEDPSAELLPASKAIHILSLAPKKEYYPAVFKVLQQTKDEDARLAAIRALGFYSEARQRLIEISRDPNEKEAFREAALGALYGGDKENIIAYVTPILTDKSATPRLQIIAMQMTIDVRQSMAYRAKAKKPDAYDILIKDISEGKGVLNSPEVLAMANKYVQSVRPKY